MVVDIFSSKGSHMPFSRMLPDVLEAVSYTHLTLPTTPYV